ncbi:MAG: hypothetical protein HYX27_14850 [Acidobacteria bacterium]|nr:hypothetical protein [Acidobacteriota bacterium]
MYAVASITSAVRRDGAGIAVTVIYTNEAATVAALHAVHDFARGLPAVVRVPMLLTVPYPLPLDRPQVNVECLLRRLRMDAPVEVRLCRDAWEGVRNRIPPSTLVVIGKGRECR